MKEKLTAIFSFHRPSRHKYTALVQTCKITQDDGGTDACVLNWRFHVYAVNPQQAFDAIKKHLHYETGEVGTREPINLIAIYPGFLEDLSGLPVIRTVEV